MKNEAQGDSSVCKVLVIGTRRPEFQSLEPTFKTKQDICICNIDTHTCTCAHTHIHGLYNVAYVCVFLR